MMTTTIQRVDFPDDRRILMISDLHGHADGLRALLKDAGFCKEDILVIVGDYVDKGPQSLAMIRCVMELCDTYTVYPLMGNVDIWRLRSLLSDDPAIQRDILNFSLYARKWWPNSLLNEMCEECGIAMEAEMDTQLVFSLFRERFQKELSFLQKLPTILETQRMIFIHGGIPHERLDELAGTDAHSLMKWDHFMEEGLSFHKYVVTGHWPVALYGSKYPCNNPIFNQKRHMIALDGGCGIKKDGQLNLVMVPNWKSDDFSFRTWSPLPVVTALEEQEETADSGFIHWGDNEVKVLERGETLARILHHGRTMTVHADDLWEQDGKILCDDFTDHCLRVLPGDSLCLIRQSPLGAYVKKDGCTGWYRGRYKSDL